MYHFRGRYRDNRGQGNSCMAACLSRRHRVCGRKCGKALYHQYPHRPPRDRLTEQFVHTELVDVFGAFARQGSASQLTLCILKSEDSCSSALLPKTEVEVDVRSSTVPETVSLYMLTSSFWPSLMFSRIDDMSLPMSSVKCLVFESDQSVWLELDQ